LKQRSSHQTIWNCGLSAHQTHPVAIIQRAQLDPSSLTRQDVLHLQSTIGNRAVGRLLIQAPQNVSHTSSLPVAQKQPAESVFGLSVQRQEGVEEELQAKSNSSHISEVNPNLESRIQSLKRGGQSLSENDRDFFKPRFGHDFSQVRVHTDT